MQTVPWRELACDTLDGQKPVACGDVGPAVLKVKKLRSEEAGNEHYELPALQFQNNARRDNLQGYWRDLYGRHHAILRVTGFFENVPRHLFEPRDLRAAEAESNLVLQFNPRPPIEMTIACLWDRWTQPGERDLLSFAAVTDEPPPEIAATDHQRCIIALRDVNVGAWLSPEGLERERLEALLSDPKRPYYEHQIAA